MKPPADIMEGKASVHIHSPSRLQNRGSGKSSLSLEEIKELAEKQKQQIYQSNKELLAKQQKLLQLQHGYKNKARYSPSVSSQSEQDTYAKKLRETYQNHLERLREMQIVQLDEGDRRFNNVELSFELNRIRDMFLAKQRELASTVAKVASLTKELEERKSGVTTWNITPEKMRRRRKIQAAREELDKLRNEMTVRNELNNKQSQELKVQKEILREKHREVNDLDARIHMLRKQLRQYQAKGTNDSFDQRPLNGDNIVKGSFSPSYLYDTLQRKRIASKSLPSLNQSNYEQQSYDSNSPSLPDVNGNVFQQTGQGRNGYNYRQSPVIEQPGRRKLENGDIKKGSPVPCTRRGNLYVAPDGREFNRPPTWDDLLDGDKQDNSRVFSPTFSTQSEASISSTGSLKQPPSPNLPQGRTDVKPAFFVNGLNSPKSSQTNSPKTGSFAFQDSPLSGHPRRELFTARLTDSLKPVPNGNSLSPSSSVSSLSSMSSNLTNDDLRPSLLISKENKEPPPPPPPYSSCLTRPDRSSVNQAQGYSTSKHTQDIWNDATEFRALESSSPIPPVPLPSALQTPVQPLILSKTVPFCSPSSIIFNDSVLSKSVDVISSRVVKLVDAKKSTAREVIDYGYLHRAVEMLEQSSSDLNLAINGTAESLGDESFHSQDINSVAPTVIPSSAVTFTPNKIKPQIAPKPTRQAPPPPPVAPKPTNSVSTVDTSQEVPSESKSVKSITEKFTEQKTDFSISTREAGDGKQIEGTNNTAADPETATKVNNGNEAPSFDDGSLPSLDETDNIAVDLNKEFPPPPPYIPKIPDHDPPPYSEIENYELSSFADIDMISATQNDLLPFLINASRSQYMNDSQDSIYDSDSSSQKSDNEKIAPVVISVPPEEMPPPILAWPGQERKPKRKVQLDPHALLLDASLEGELAIVKQILNKVPDPSLPNAEGITALHNAVCGNHKDVVKFLVEIGCDINSADNNGWTPLHCAAFYNDTELCSYLVEHGASVYANTYSDCQTPSQKCSRLEDNYDQCFQYLHDSKDHVGKLNENRVYTLFDYTVEVDDELSFRCGEVLTIRRRGDQSEKEWWWAENSRGESGYVPYNLLGLHPRVAAEV